MKMKKSKMMAFGLCTVFALAGFTACRQEMTRREQWITDAFENVAIVSKTADVEILPATDGVCKIFASERKGWQYKVSVQDSSLTVELEDTRKWYQFQWFNLTMPTLTVYLPDAEYKNLSIDDLFKL